MSSARQDLQSAAGEVVGLWGRPGSIFRSGSRVVTVVDADDVRRIALSLPETVEKEAWSMPTFRVAGKMFITVPDDQTSFAVRCPKHDRAELIAAEPEKFWVPPHEASSAWVRVRLGALEDMAELYDILVDSWKQAAPDRLVENFRALGPADPGEGNR